MPSAIDISKPIFGTPSTQSVRDNFHYARDEITELMDRADGFVERDGDTMTGPLLLARDVPRVPTEATPMIWVLNQIRSTVNTLIFIGSYDGENDLIMTSNSDRFPVGSPLPEPTNNIAQMYVISRTASPPGSGIGNQPEGGVPVGAWVICNGESWNVWVGDVPEGVSAQTIAIDPPIPNVPATNVYQAFEVIGDHWYDYQYYVAAHRFWPYLIVENFFVRDSQYGSGWDHNKLWFGERTIDETRVLPPKPGTIGEIPDPPVNEYPIEEFDPIWDLEYDRNKIMFSQHYYGDDTWLQDNPERLILGSITGNTVKTRGFYMTGGNWVFQIADQSNVPGYEIWRRASAGWTKAFRIGEETGSISTYADLYVGGTIDNNGNAVVAGSLYGPSGSAGMGIWGVNTPGDSGSHIGMRSAAYAAMPRAVQIYANVHAVDGPQYTWTFDQGGTLHCAGQVSTGWGMLSTMGVMYRSNIAWCNDHHFAWGYQTHPDGYISCSVNGGGAHIVLAHYSDGRLKTDIKPSTVDCLDVVKQIPLDSFIFKTVPDIQHIEKYKTIRDTKHTRKIGLIAQKLYKICPDLIHEGDYNVEGKVGSVWSINDDSMFSLLIGAIQQLNSKLEQLGAK